MSVCEVAGRRLDVQKKKKKKGHRTKSLAKKRVTIIRIKGLTKLISNRFRALNQ